jgi:hypothetical protein
MRGMDWVDLAQHRDTWRAVLNAAMKLRVPLNTRNFLISWEPVASQKDSAPWSK